MQQFIIGKEGNQPFPITSNLDLISDQHAIITISDDGEWILEDKSGKGTFIQKKDGNFTQISKIAISKDTVIRLGAANRGFTFSAYRIITKDTHNYEYEFKLLKEHRKEINKKEEKYQKWSSGFQIGIMIVIFLSTFQDDFNFIIRLSMALSIPFKLFQQKQQKVINKKKRLLLICPQCARPLSEYELDSEQCLKCKIHS